VTDQWDEQFRNADWGERDIDLPANLAERVRERWKTQRDRRRRLQAASVGLIVAFAAWFAMSTEQPDKPLAAVPEIDDETRELIASIHAKLDELNQQLDSWEQEEATVADEPSLADVREEPAFTIIHKGAILEKLDGDPETAAFAYRSVMKLYAGTIWADVARQQLEQMNKPEEGMP
jgi:hypothetical protein